MACGGLDDDLWDWERKVILCAGMIEVAEVLADSYLPILLLHRDNTGEPPWILRLLDETCSD